MQYEDQFDPTLSNDVPEIKPQEADSYLHKLKSGNQNYFSEDIILPSENGKNKKLKIQYYGSGPQGSFIREATSGNIYKGLYVGSDAENLFFKVRMVKENMPNGLTLFYLSPEAYEKHQLCTVDDSIKSKWLERNLVTKKKYDF